MKRGALQGLSHPGTGEKTLLTGLGWCPQIRSSISPDLGSDETSDQEMKLETGPESGPGGTALEGSPQPW